MTSVRWFAPLFVATVLLAAPRLAVRADDGEKTFREVCGSCHDANTRPLDAKRMTREKWKEEVERMQGLGADIPSGKKLSDLLDYLARTHGPEGAGKDEKK